MAGPVHKIWDAATGIELLAFKVTVGDLGSMCLAPDGQSVAVSTISGSRVTIWPLERAKEPVKPGGNDPLEKSPDFSGV